MDIHALAKLLGMLTIIKEATSYEAASQQNDTSTGVLWLPPGVTQTPTWVPNNLGQLFIPHQLNARADSLSITSVSGGTVANNDLTHIWTGDPQTNTDDSVINEGGIVYVVPSTTIIVGPGGYGTIAVPPGATLPTPLIPTEFLTSETTFRTRVTATINPPTSSSKTSTTSSSEPAPSNTQSISKPSELPRKKVGDYVDWTDFVTNWIYSSNSGGVETASYHAEDGQWIDHPVLRWAYSPNDIETKEKELDKVLRDYQRNFGVMLESLPHPNE